MTRGVSEKGDGRAPSSDAVPTEGVKLRRQIANGRTAVLVLIAVMLGMSLAWIFLFMIYRGPERLVGQLVRFALEIGLMVLLYRGVPWARWLTVVLLSVAAPLLFFTAGAPGSPLLDLFVTALSFYYVIFVIALLTEANVKTFLQYQYERDTRLD